MIQKRSKFFVLLIFIFFLSGANMLLAQGSLGNVEGDYLEEMGSVAKSWQEEDKPAIIQTLVLNADIPAPPTFSHPSGFYSSGFSLTLSHPNPVATIIYTLDGSDPAIENLWGLTYTYKNQYPQDPGQKSGPLLTNTYISFSYSAPLPIIDRSPFPNKLANISSTWHFKPDYFPKKPLKKAVVVRAAAYVGGVKSLTKTHTFFVSSGSAFQRKLPIAAISLNEDALFDYEKGIYVAGIDFDKWREDNPSGITNGHRPANYRRTGSATEKAASFQYFVDGREVINQNIGLRLHGSFSKLAQNKTFRLYAREEYDEQNKFRYPFFGSTNSSSFKRLLLRNSGNDAGNLWIGNALVPTISPSVYFRDAFTQKMVEHLRFDTQDYVPVITFVNGEYWGLLNLRERYDEHYIFRKYGIPESELEFLENNASVKIGSNTHYNMMRSFISVQNLSIDDNYNYVKTLMDVDNFIDYQISEIYARNTDWPGNNIAYFRRNTSTYEPQAPYGQDGRWRWLMFDTDHGFGWSGEESYTHNSLQNASGNNSSTIILYKLLQNQHFLYDFINRYADLLNTAFLPQRLVAMIYEMAGKIADEIPLHQERWNTLPDWETNVGLMCNFAEQRPAYARLHIREKFKIGSTITTTLNVSNTEHGYIRINTIDVNKTTPGVPANPYPWSGVYFQNIPIIITAKPYPGFKFSNWSGVSNSSEHSISLVSTSDFSLKANFVAIQPDDYELVYFWLFDNRIENDTPLKTINSTFSNSNSRARINFFSSFGEGYPFNEAHKNWREGSLERRNAPTPLNYEPAANYNFGYGSVDMKGLQAKGPFLGEGHENVLMFEIPTSGYENITLSFAAMAEGATKELKVDYFSHRSGMWIESGLVSSNTVLTDNYVLFQYDFAQVHEANNNQDFMVRIRFDGADLKNDNDNRVTFNNIAIRGTALLPGGIQDKSEEIVFIYPNPVADVVTIHVTDDMAGAFFNINDLAGKSYLSGKLQDKNTTLLLGHLPLGVYFLNVQGSTSKVFKLIKR
jgi:hypothetical protein